MTKNELLEIFNKGINEKTYIDLNVTQAKNEELALAYWDNLDEKLKKETFSKSFVEFNEWQYKNIKNYYSCLSKMIFNNNKSIKNKINDFFNNNIELKKDFIICCLANNKEEVLKILKIDYSYNIMIEFFKNYNIDLENTSKYINYLIRGSRYSNNYEDYLLETIKKVFIDLKDIEIKKRNIILKVLFYKYNDYFKYHKNEGLEFIYKNFLEFLELEDNVENKIIILNIDYLLEIEEKKDIIFEKIKNETEKEILQDYNSNLNLILNWIIKKNIEINQIIKNYILKWRKQEKANLDNLYFINMNESLKIIFDVLREELLNDIENYKNLELSYHLIPVADFNFIIKYAKILSKYKRKRVVINFRNSEFTYENVQNTVQLIEEIIKENEIELLKKITINYYSVQEEDLQKVINLILNKIKDKKEAYNILIGLIDMQEERMTNLLNDELANKIYKIKRFLG